MDRIEHQQVSFKDGTITSMGWDDAEHLSGVFDDQPKIITNETLSHAINDMPEAWVRARVRGWMMTTESPDQDFWIGTYIDKKWVYCSSHEDRYTPMMHRIEYARNVCKYLNRHCAHGGVWLSGWIRGGGEFYCLWKDQDGDLAIPLECNVPFTQLIGWSMEDWAEHAEQAHAVYVRMKSERQLSPGQEVKLAQGEQVSADHMANEPAIGI